MKNDNETKDRLLENAKKEFIEKGYTKASLRNICKNSDATTGALYFFFQNKEELFASLVEEPLNKLQEIINQHYKMELNQLNTETIHINDFSVHFESAKQITHCMYKYYDEFQLLLTKSQGSRFEKCLDHFVDITEKQYRILADKICLQKNLDKLDDYMIHWITHTQVDLFVHMLTHEKSEEAALKHIEAIIKYLVVGWNQLFE